MMAVMIVSSLVSMMTVKLISVSSVISQILAEIFFATIISYFESLKRSVSLRNKDDDQVIMA